MSTESEINGYCLIGIRSIRYLLIGLLVTIALSFCLFLFFILYPFKTVEFLGNPPIRIVNIDKKVENGGVVHMAIDSRKYIDNPGLVTRTLVRKTEGASSDNIGHQYIPLGSSTVVSTRKAGRDIVHSVYMLTEHPENVGPDTVIVFSVNYTLFGFLPKMVVYESEPFEIVPKR